MAELLDRITSEVQTRVRELDAERRDLDRLAGELRKINGRATGRRRPRTRRTANGGAATVADAMNADATATNGKAPKGFNRAAVLVAIATKPKTAGEVSAETGIGRQVVSTMLYQLAKDGEARKMKRGYKAKAAAVATVERVTVPPVAKD